MNQNNSGCQHTYFSPTDLSPRLRLNCLRVFHNRGFEQLARNTIKFNLRNLVRLDENQLKCQIFTLVSALITNDHQKYLLLMVCLPLFKQELWDFVQLKEYFVAYFNRELLRPKVDEMQFYVQKRIKTLKAKGLLPKCNGEMKVQVCMKEETITNEEKRVALPSFKEFCSQLQ